MTDFLATREDVARALEGSPPRPLSPVASGLAGWRRTGPALELCADCTGRLLSRFFGCGALRGWTAVTEPDGVHCCACLADSRPCLTVGDVVEVLRPASATERTLIGRRFRVSRFEGPYMVCSDEHGSWWINAGSLRVVVTSGDVDEGRVCR